VAAIFHRNARFVSVVSEPIRVDFVDVRHALEPIDEMRQGKFTGTPILFRLFHTAPASGFSMATGSILGVA
jgi:hypothetical protein